jgi:hypothetical protein
MVIPVGPLVNRLLLIEGLGLLLLTAELLPLRRPSKSSGMLSGRCSLLLLPLLLLVPLTAAAVLLLLAARKAIALRELKLLLREPALMGRGGVSLVVAGESPEATSLPKEVSLALALLLMGTGTSTALAAATGTLLLSVSTLLVVVAVVLVVLSPELPRSSVAPFFCVVECAGDALPDLARGEPHLRGLVVVCVCLCRVCDTSNETLVSNY